MALWVWTPVWHLYRLARLMPLYGTMGNNARSHVTMGAIALAAAMVRYVVLGAPDVTIHRVISGAVSLAMYLAVVWALVQVILRATVHFFPSAKEKGDFINVASVAAWGCSAVVDLAVSVLIWLGGYELNTGVGSTFFQILEVGLILSNVIILRIQAKTRHYVRTVASARVKTRTAS